MPFFKKKPVIIEAHQWDGSAAGAHFIIEWSAGKVTGIYDHDSKPYLMIDTLSGPVPLAVGEWIIKGVAHELYPCAPDVFGFTYEAVSQAKETDG